MPKAKKKRTVRLSLEEIAAALAEVARVGEVFVDGELVKNAYMAYATDFMCGDDMDYNPVTTVPLKKTLMRLERLSRVSCSTTIWRRRPDDPKSGEVLLSGFMTSPQGGGPPPNLGYVRPRMSPELSAIFLRGKSRVIKVDRKPSMMAHVMNVRGRGTPAKGVKGYAMVQVYAPVKDSLGEVVGVLEVFTSAVG